MPDPSDFLPFLTQYGNIAHEHLRKHLTDEQISDYLDYLHTTTTTHGEAFRRITVEDGRPTTVFYALESLGRINALCNAAECPSEEPITPEKAFHVAFAALRAGMVIGAVVDDKGKEGILALANHGAKFAGNVGRKPGPFVQLLESIVEAYCQDNHDFPDYLTVIRLLRREIGKGFVHSVDEIDGIEYGDSGSISIRRLQNILSDIKKKI